MTGDSSEELFRPVIAKQPKNGGPCGPDDLARTIDEQEPQRLDVAKHKTCGALLGARPLAGSCIDLKVREEIVGQDDDLLPRTVRAVVVSRDRVEGESALELPDGLLVRASAAHEVPEPSDIEAEIGGDGGVLEVPVVGIKQIELVVLPRMVPDALAIDHGPHGDSPGLEIDRVLESVDICVDSIPSFPGRDQALQIQPLPEGDLDGVAGATVLQDSEDSVEEERAVHADIHAIARAESLPNLSEEVAKECEGRLPIMDVARTILHSQDVSGLGEIRRSWVVARDLSVMGIESAERALHRQSRRHHGPVYINCQRSDRKGADAHRHDARVQGAETIHRVLRESFEPAADRATRWKTGQPAESADERIALQELDVSESSPPDEDEHQKETNHRDETKVTRQVRRRKMLPDQLVQLDRTKVPQKKLKAGVGRQARGRELRSKISVDSARQIGSSSPHRMWPFVWG